MKRMSERFSCAALLACAGLALSSCANDGHHPEVAAQQLADEATQRVCDILQTCCDAAHIPYREQGCKALNGPGILQHFYAQTFLGAELDAEAAKRCLDAIGKVSDGCPVDRASGYLTEACDGVFKGTVPRGGQCDPSHGCDTRPDAPLFCERQYEVERERDVNPGVCIATPATTVHNLVGQACSQTCLALAGTPCVILGVGGSTGDDSKGKCYTSDGLFCSSQSNQCELQSVSGGPCVGSHECAAGTYCEFEDFECAPTRPLGAACTVRTQCGENDYCTAGTCQRPPRATPELCVGQIPPPPQD